MTAAWAGQPEYAPPIRKRGGRIEYEEVAWLMSFRYTVPAIARELRVSKFSVDRFLNRHPELKAMCRG